MGDDAEKRRNYVRTIYARRGRGEQVVVKTKRETCTHTINPQQYIVIIFNVMSEDAR